MATSVRKIQSVSPDQVAPVAPEATVEAFIDYVEEFLMILESANDSYQVSPHIRMSLELLRRHFQSKMTQPTYIVETSGVPYATATRKLNELIESGLIDRRAKSKTERSFSLHPSDRLLEIWTQMAVDHQEVLSEFFDVRLSEREHEERFFGSHYFSERSAPPLNVLSKPLTLAGGLKILAHSDPSFLVMSNLKRHFEVVTGCPVHYRSFTLDKLYDEALANGQRDRGSFDLMAVNLPWVGEFADTEMLLPLDDLLDVERLDPTDFHEASWRACHWKGRCYGIPVETTCELLMYRTDLLSEHRLLPPSTTDELLAVARELHRPDKGIYGIAWNAARGTALGHTFMMAMADFGQPIIDLKKTHEGFSTSDIGLRQYKPMIDTDVGLRAAEFLCQLLEVSPPGILTMSWYERTKFYAEGRVAMAYGFSQMAPYFEQDERSPAYGNTAYVPHPSGCGRDPISPVGGFILGVPSNINPRRIPDVVTALETFTSARAQRLYLENGSRGCSRYSATENPTVRAASPVIETIEELARKGLLQSWPRPPVPEIGSITQLCGVVMHEMLRGIITPKEAIQRAQLGAQQIIENWQNT